MTNTEALTLKPGEKVRSIRNPRFPDILTVAYVEHCEAAERHPGIPSVVVVIAGGGSLLPADIERSR